MNIKNIEEDSIEFLQSKDSAAIKERLQKSITKCESLKGAIAFWTIDTNYFSGLEDKLKHKDSFICTDIHQPTNIDCLQQFVEAGVKNIYLFLYCSKEKGNSKHYPLMHAKLLLFNLPNDKVEIWIGSQNFTDNALSGFNLEATSVISTTKNSEYCQEVDNYLEFIKNCCADIGKICPEIGKQFNPELVDFYKKLQGTYDYKEKKHDVLDFICKNKDDIQKIAINDSIFVASICESDCNKFFTKKIIIIRAIYEQEPIICYEAEVQYTGKITAVNKETLVTTYVDGEKTHYQTKSSIIQRKKEKSPIFVPFPPQEADFFNSKQDFDKDNQYTFVIIKPLQKFKEELYPSEKKSTFWINLKINPKNLFYLSYHDFIVAAKEKEQEKKLQTPKSPSTIKQKNSHPFDKIRNAPDEAIINKLRQITLDDNEDGNQNTSEEYRVSSIIRELVTKDDEDDAETV